MNKKAVVILFCIAMILLSGCIRGLKERVFEVNGEQIECESGKASFGGQNFYDCNTGKDYLAVTNFTEINIKDD